MAEENENAPILYIGRFLSSNYFGASWYSKIPAPKLVSPPLSLLHWHARRAVIHPGSLPSACWAAQNRLLAPLAP